MNRANNENSLITWYKNSDPAQRRSAGNIFKFLAVLLALTLIARGTSGATLARVELATPVRSEIVDAVFGAATVAAADFIEITVPEGLVISEMHVSVGQTLAVGDVIATLGEVADRHIREIASLDRMNLDLERLEREDNPDAASVDNAQRNLQRARDDYNAAVRQGREDIEAARIAFETLLYSNEYTDSHPAAVRNYLRVLEDFYAVKEQGQADILAARNALSDAQLGLNADDTNLQTAIRNHARVLEDFYATVEQGEADITVAKNILDELLARRPADQDRTALDTAQRNLDRAIEDHNSAIRQGGDTLSSASRLEDAEASFSQAQRNFYEGIQAEIDRAEAALETAINRAADSLLAVTRRLEDAEVSLTQARQNFERNVQNEIDRAKAALETAESRAADNLLTAARRLEDASVNIDTEIERAYAALQNAITRAEDARQAAARRVEDAIVSLNNAEQSYLRSVDQNVDISAQNNITASVLRLDIQNQESVVSSLDVLMLNGGTLYSETVGVVSSVMQQGGTTGRTPIITLYDTSGGFTAQMTLPRDDAWYVSIGSEAVVTTGGGSIFFTPTTTGIVSSISSPDENDRVSVAIALPAGNWSVGQRVDAQVVLSSANFDMSVPASAVHSDNAGYFIFVMEERSTVLGIQNVVVRVNVTIVAADNDMAALRGPVNRDTQVIIGSNKATSEGDRVRVNN